MPIGVRLPRQDQDQEEEKENDSRRKLKASTLIGDKISPENGSIYVKATIF